MIEFITFIVEMEIIDLPVLGGNFNWHKVDGSIMSMLDRFLISEPLLKSWNLDCQYASYGDISDHNPL